MHADAVAAALAQAHRSEWAFVLSATVRVAGDLDVAEECAQEAQSGHGPRCEAPSSTR